MIEVKPQKKTLDEWQKENGNIFSYLIDTLQVEYLQGTDAVTMKFLLSSMFGQRTARIFIEELSADEVGHYIHQVYSERWQKNLDLIKKFDGLEGDSVVTGQDDSTSGTDRTTSTNQRNKVSGFDSEQMVDDHGSDISGVDGINTTLSHAQTNTSTTQSGILSKISATKRHEFLEEICRDIVRFIALPIY